MRGTRAALAAVACGALVGIPALARAQQPDPVTGEVTAKDVGTMGDGRFSVNGTDATTLTVATGATVTFDYPTGASYHNVDFTEAKPSSCRQTAGADLGPVPPLPGGPAPHGWAGTCTFSAPGTYAFRCDLHADMTGTIVVRDPVAATPTPTPSPGATPLPTPTATPVASPPPTLRGAVKLARRQTGTRVRGSVRVTAPRSRLEVTLRARKLGRVGRWAKRVDAGRATFSVRLTAKARAVLRRHHRLALTATVALTPPGTSRTFHVTVRRY